MSVSGAPIARVGVLCCPNWPVVVAGATAGEAVIVLRANRVVAVSVAAGDQGVTIGMRRRQAQACSPGARLVAADPDGEARAFEPLVRAVATMVPRLEVTEPGLLGFLARGPARYFGGETAMATRMIELARRAVGAPGPGGSLDAAGGVGVGIGHGRFAAGIAARRSVRTGAPVVLDEGIEATRRFLADLPIAALSSIGGVPVELVELFARLGLRRLGQLADLDERDVLARFAEPGRSAHRLARGLDERPADVTDPPVGRAVQHEFPEPVHHSDIVVFQARRVAEALIDGLAGEGRTCTRLDVLVETEHGERSRRVWCRPDGLSAAAVVERVRWQLDGWAASGPASTGGITRVRLDPVEVRAATGTQPGMWGGRTHADEWAGRAVHRLVAVVGETEVHVPARGAGRLPGEVLTWVPAATADLTDATERLRSPAGPWPGRVSGPPPTVIHDPPRPMVVHDADNQPVGVDGRGAVSAAPAGMLIDGRRRSVTQWAGPWPVEQRWWDPTMARRLARFQLVADDGRLIEAAVEHRRWWMLAEHG